MPAPKAPAAAAGDSLPPRSTASESTLGLAGQVSLRGLLDQLETRQQIKQKGTSAPDLRPLRAARSAAALQLGQEQAEPQNPAIDTATVDTTAAVEAEWASWASWATGSGSGPQAQPDEDPHEVLIRKVSDWLDANNAMQDAGIGDSAAPPLDSAAALARAADSQGEAGSPPLDAPEAAKLLGSSGKSTASLSAPALPKLPAQLPATPELRASESLASLGSHAEVAPPPAARTLESVQLGFMDIPSASASRSTRPSPKPVATSPLARSPTVSLGYGEVPRAQLDFRQMPLSPMKPQRPFDPLAPEEASVGSAASSRGASRRPGTWRDATPNGIMASPIPSPSLVSSPSAATARRVTAIAEAQEGVPSLPTVVEASPEVSGEMVQKADVEVTSLEDADSPSQAPVRRTRTEPIRNKDSSSSSSSPPAGWTSQDKESHARRMLEPIFAGEDGMVRLFADVYAGTPLPAPWTACRNDQGKLIFVNSHTGKASWRSPLDRVVKETAVVCRSFLNFAPAQRDSCLTTLQQQWDSEISEQLAQWRAAEDTASGKQYYYHLVTKETMWQSPAEVFLPAHYFRMKVTELFRSSSNLQPELNRNSSSQGSSTPTSPGGQAGTTETSESKLKVHRSFLRKGVTAGFMENTVKR